MTDRDDLLPYHRNLGRSLRDVLLAHGVFTEEELARAIAEIDSPTPGNGARLVARAWIDAAFKARLLEDPKSAAAELGIDTGPRQVRILESTPQVHNVIVCTLCSCYPRFLLGQPPAWYKSRPYRSRVVREPRAVLAEFGTVVADDVVVRVHDSTAELRYMVLPLRPPGSDGMNEAALTALVTRDSLIGVALVHLPAANQTANPTTGSKA